MPSLNRGTVTNLLICAMIHNRFKAGRRDIYCAFCCKTIKDFKKCYEPSKMILLDWDNPSGGKISPLKCKEKIIITVIA